MRWECGVRCGVDGCVPGIGLRGNVGAACAAGRLREQAMTGTQQWCCRRQLMRDGRADAPPGLVMGGGKRQLWALTLNPGNGCGKPLHRWRRRSGTQKTPLSWLGAGRAVQRKCSWPGGSPTRVRRLGQDGGRVEMNAPGNLCLNLTSDLPVTLVWAPSQVTRRSP